MTFPVGLPDWSNLNVLHQNTLPARAHFYSYASEDAALSFDRKESEFQSLNGTWKFQYDPSPFVAPAWDSADTGSWDDIEVPGMWQRQGYGRPQYTNIDYPFPITPPNVSYVNPTGSYWREFEVPEDWDEQQIRLRYEGVDSAFHVWVNGEEVGYSQGSRNPSEFDITDYIARGDTNTLATRVYQWSDATYLEDQDQWWLSGIFRDVYLVPFPASSIVDFFIKPDVDENLSSGTLRVNITIQGEHGDMKIKTLLPNGDPLDEWTGSSSDVYQLEVSGDAFELWSAETPNLYTVLITFNGRTVSQKIGFRRIEQNGPNFLVNGKPIMIHGVNRHEHHYLSGRTVSYEDMRADLVLMKRSNINTIRTAHQPHHPDFYDVADELGFYVIAEADLECHGFGDQEDPGSWLSDNPEWEHAYLDRAEQLVERFKNHASIIFWSLGNECFYGQNFAAMYSWIKERDPSRLIHYEADREAASADVYSRMYLSLDDVRAHVANYTDKAFILCEFAHAMGNGPGGLKDYIELFRSEPLVQGGLVWEFNNHGLLKREGDLEYYAYGGDFGDVPNDADFIMDGLTNSDHSPMPSLNEYAKAIQPVTVRLSGDASQMIVANHYDFVNLGGLKASWHLVQDGHSTEPRELELPEIPAGEERTVELPHGQGNLTQEAWLTIEFQLANDELWASEGHVVAWDQLHLAGPGINRRRSGMIRDVTHVARQDGLNITEEQARLEVTHGSTTFGFDLLQGNVTWSVDGVDILERGPELTFYRAMTQNDVAWSGDWSNEWEEFRVDMMSMQVRDVTWAELEEGFTIKLSVFVGAIDRDWGAVAELAYTILPGESLLRVRVTGDFIGEKVPSVLPHIGLMAVLPKEFNEVAWFGRGPGESYADSKEGSRIGHYESSVDDLFYNYEYPQENGNREDLRWVQISAPSHDLTLDARMIEAPFSFTARRYMPYDLDEATHPHRLEPLNMTVLHLDYKTHGVGSATVGPTAFEPYRCLTEPFDFTFELSLV